MPPAQESDPISPELIFPGADPAGIPRALMKKYDLVNEQELNFALELLDGLVVTNRQNHEQEHSSDTERRRIMRATLTQLRKDAVKALSLLERIQSDSSAFLKATGGDLPEASFLRTVFANIPIHSVDAPEAYYLIRSINASTVAASNTITPLLRDMATVEISDRRSTGKMANESLRVGLRICFVYLVHIEGKEWGNANLRKSDIRKFKLEKSLSSLAERFVYDVFRLAGINFTLTQLNGRWLDTQEWARKVGRISLEEITGLSVSSFENDGRPFFQREALDAESHSTALCACWLSHPRLGYLDASNIPMEARVTKKFKRWLADNLGIKPRNVVKLKQSKARFIDADQKPVRASRADAYTAGNGDPIKAPPGITSRRRRKAAKGDS